MALFDGDVRYAVLDTIPFDESAAAELKVKNAADLLIIYFNWLNRHLAVTPRRVHQSRELKKTRLGLSSERQDALKKIVKDIRHGKNLTRYLSKRVVHAYVAQHQRPSGLKDRRDLDLLLNAWGVHHMHVSKVVGPNGFVTRSGSLLFAAFTASDAYLIDVMTHRDFHRRHILEVMAKTWPDAGLVLGSLAGARLTQQHSEEEEKELREAGVSLLEEVDGRVVMPRDTVTTAGTSMQATRRTNDVMHKVDEIERQLSADPHFLEAQFKERVVFTDRPRWRFELRGWECGLRDEETGAIFLI